MNTSLVHVPFYGTILFLVDVNGEPYTPMKPIVEGMSLDWSSQFTKLKSDQKRWGSIVINTIQVPGDTQSRETVMMPLRKLPGWLMTIHPTRVKPEIRETILRYQNECDDVLWEYWTKGIAVNPRGVSEFDRLVRRIDALTQRVARLENLSRSSPPSGRPPEESVRGLPRYTPEQKEAIRLYRKLEKSGKTNEKTEFLLSEYGLLLETLNQTYLKERRKKGLPDPEDSADFVAWLVVEYPDVLQKVEARFVAVHNQKRRDA